MRRCSGGTRNCGASRGFGHHGAGRGTRCDGGRRRRRDNRRSLARGGNDFAWLRTRRRSGRGSLRRRRGRRRRSFDSRRSRRLLRQPAAPRLFFVFFLLGQDGLEGIARLGNMRQIDLGRDGLRVGAARLRPGCTSPRPTTVLKVGAHLGRFVFIKRTGVGFPRAQTQFRQHVENLAALDLQLACQIVDSNLAHPPLFKFCYPKPARCSWLPHGVGCWFHFHYYRIGLVKRRQKFAPPA